MQLETATFYINQGYIHAGLIGYAPVLRQFVYKSWSCETFTLNLATFVLHTFVVAGMEITNNNQTLLKH